MALLLSLETSTQTCSVALHNKGVLLAYQEVLEPRSAASQLAVSIQHVLRAATVKPAELQGIIVAAGPGSYTGLRIGVATAKGMCYALRIPLIAVNTLDVLASLGRDQINIMSEEDFLCPMLDARRMEVYCKVVNYRLQELEPTQAKIIDQQSFMDYLIRGRVYFFGDGASKCRSIMNHPNSKFLENIVPLASRLGEMGYAKWPSQDFEAVDSFEPFYLKDFLIRKPTLS